MRILHAERATLERALSAGAGAPKEVKVKKEAGEAEVAVAMAAATQAALTKVLRASAVQLPVPTAQPALAHLQQQDTNVCLLQSLGLLPPPTAAQTASSALAANLLGLSEGLQLPAALPVANAPPYPLSQAAMVAAVHQAGPAPQARLVVVKEKASPYRGITRRKKRWEAHVWRHGKQVRGQEIKITPVRASE